MKQKFQTKYVIPVASILFGAVFAGISLNKYELIDATKGPMSGFLPVVVGGLLVLVGAIDLLQAKNYAEPVFEKENWYLVLGVLLVIAGSYLFGILPGGYLLAFWWLKYKEKYSWKVTALVMAFLAVLVIGVFVLWLDIPFEYGIIGELLKNR